MNPVAGGIAGPDLRSPAGGYYYGSPVIIANVARSLHKNNETDSGVLRTDACGRAARESARVETGNNRRSHEPIAEAGLEAGFTGGPCASSLADGHGLVNGDKGITHDIGATRLHIYVVTGRIVAQHRGLDAKEGILFDRLNTSRLQEAAHVSGRVAETDVADYAHDAGHGNGRQDERDGDYDHQFENGETAIAIPCFCVIQH